MSLRASTVLNVLAQTPWTPPTLPSIEDSTSTPGTIRSCPRNATLPHSPALLYIDFSCTSFCPPNIRCGNIQYFHAEPIHGALPEPLSHMPSIQQVSEAKCYFRYLTKKYFSWLREKKNHEKNTTTLWWQVMLNLLICRNTKLHRTWFYYFFLKETELVPGTLFFLSSLLKECIALK